MKSYIEQFILNKNLSEQNIAIFSLELERYCTEARIEKNELTNDEINVIFDAIDFPTHV